MLTSKELRPSKKKIKVIKNYALYSIMQNYMIPNLFLKILHTKTCLSYKRKKERMMFACHLEIMDTWRLFNIYAKYIEA